MKVIESCGLAVIGAGLIGKRHLERISGSDKCHCVAICDTDPGCSSLAAKLGVPFYTDYNELLRHEDPDGAIVATPTDQHTDAALACAENKVHMLVEKPISATVSDGLALIRAANEYDVRVLVGHYRRFSPFVQRARTVVQDGEIGTLASVLFIWAILKPQDYFRVEWRTQPGGGPVLINLIHEIDILRFVCGEIRSVFAATSSAIRGFEVEDTACFTLQFDNGALGSIVGSDAVPSPWSYESTTFEMPAFNHADGNCAFFMGTKGSLAFPRMEVWRYPDTQNMGWQYPLTNLQLDVERADPLTAQLEHFCRVIRGTEEPLIDGEDGLQSLAVTLAALESARNGVPVVVSPNETSAKS